MKGTLSIVVVVLVNVWGQSVAAQSLVLQDKPLSACSLPTGSNGSGWHVDCSAVGYILDRKIPTAYRCEAELTLDGKADAAPAAKSSLKCEMLPKPVIGEGDFDFKIDPAFDGRTTGRHNYSVYMVVGQTSRKVAVCFNIPRPNAGIDNLWALICDNTELKP